MRALSNDRRAINQAMQNLLPKVMFAVLPLVALVQFWIYRRQRPFYLENLVFVLHFQSFYYMASTLALLLAAGIGALAGAAARIGELFEFAIYVWSVVYCSSPCDACIARASSRPCSDSPRWRCRM